MKTSFRVLYRQLIPILCCCLLLTALTGIILGLSDLLDLPDIVTKILTTIHQGAILGGKISPIYVLLMGLGVFVLELKTVIEGGYSLLFQQAQPILVNVYRVIALILVIPLTLCVETGVAYRLGKDWFGISNEQTSVFLSIHGGSSLGTILSIVYLLAVGLALITLSILSWKNSQNSSKQRQPQQTSQQPLKLYSDYSSQHSNTNKSPSVPNNKVKVVIIYGLIALLGILYYTTSALFATIAGLSIVVVLAAVILGRKSHNGWQEQQQTISRLHEQEAESITILRAIPDSMLRISHDGICLSYLPAKEASSFVLHGDIINKHITEFLALEIARQFTKSTQLSLQTGSTITCHFSIPVGNEKQYHEARVTPIGQTEVLILVREIDDSNCTSKMLQESLVNKKNTASVQVLTELELVRVLETILIEQNAQNHILICLAINTSVIGDDDAVINDDLLFKIANRIGSTLPSSVVSRLENDDLIILVSDRTMEKASAIVDDLYRNLEGFVSTENHARSIEFNVALLEIDADSSNAIALVNAAKATCQMAKQKVNFKTFW